MRKSIEHLINVGNDIKLALNLAYFALYFYEEDSYIEFTVTGRISKDALKLIPNDFLIYPKDNGVCILRVFEMTEDNV